MAKLRTIATGLAVVVGTIALSAGPAQARPVDDTIVRQSDVGPDQRDWFCTYQVDVDDITCVWSPGNGSTSGKALMERPESVWWRPWTW